MNNESESLRIRCRNCGVHLDAGEMEPFSIVPCPVCGTKLRIPRRFDRYLLDRVCGRGTYTVIYRAIDPQLARWVALKVLDTGTDGDAAGMGERFFAEAKLVAKLNHPAILPVYNCGVAEGRPFLVTRYMAGGDLGKRRSSRTLPPLEKLLEIISAVAGGLQYANRTAGVVHHDVKPSNILLAGDDEVRLGDFDLADVRRHGDITTPCAAGWVRPAYASPERLLTGGEDCRGDIFSLGVTLYELLGGGMPFGYEGGPEELYERRREMAFPALCTVNPEVPEPLSDLATRMLDFAPENRPGYPELLAELDKNLRSLRDRKAK